MRKTLFMLLAACLLASPLLAQTQAIDQAKLDAYYKNMVKSWDLPGASIGIIKDGKLIFTGNYGTKTAGKKDSPDKNTLYAVASNSKAFTATIIGMLVQEGKLNWDDKVQKHIPYFQVYDPWVSSQATIRDLLSHRIGLGTFSGDVIWYKSNLTSEQIIKRFKHLPKAYDFRDGYGYSNLMYITAGEIIKKVTGKSWATNVKERILEPLGMNRSITSIKKLDEMGNYVTPHTYRDGKNLAVDWTDWTEIGAMGGLISSVEDMSKWMIFNMNHGIMGNDTLLTPATRNTIWTPHNNFQVDHTKPNALGQNFKAYGLGWNLADYHGHMMVSHTGGYDGIITAVTMIPDQNIGIVVLTNGGRSPIRPATYYALDRLLGLEEKDWSSDYLTRTQNWEASDTRIADMKASRVEGTSPSVAAEQFAGVYQSDIYGEISIIQDEDKLRLQFEHSPNLSATLTHWHYDTWQIHWDKRQPWFDFGTVQIKTDNHLDVKGLHFDIPNYDFFFEEFKPYR